MWFRKKKPEPTKEVSVVAPPHLVPKFREVTKKIPVPKINRDLTINYTDGTSEKFTLNECSLTQPHYAQYNYYRVSLIDGQEINNDPGTLYYRLQSDRENHPNVFIYRYQHNPFAILTQPELKDGLFQFQTNGKYFAINVSFIKSTELGPEYKIEETLEYSYPAIEPINLELT